MAGFPSAGCIGAPLRVALKLLHPALLWPAGNVALALGFTLDRSALPALTLAAAPPSTR